MSDIFEKKILKLENIKPIRHKNGRFGLGKLMEKNFLNIKDTINPLQLFAEKCQFLNQNNP